MTTDRPGAADYGRILPERPVDSLEGYVAEGGGSGLERATSLSPEQVIEEVRASGLRGRGGAGFPTGIKWRSVVDTAHEQETGVYLVANAAEGEPGTFKDRVLLERNPYVFLEGILVGLYATGARHAYVGIKANFERPRARLEGALDELRRSGWPGSDSITVVPGPDEYLFGEEKAMLEVIEGKLPMPRLLPPYQVGLFATTSQTNPTVANNVETLSHVAHVLRHGADWFRQLGTEASPGTMVFTVVGDVASPGVHELPLGTPLRTLLEIAAADDVKAVYSGTSNAVITPDLLDTPLCFDAMREVGVGLGSGGLVVYDAERCIVKVLTALSRFLAVESCGQCLACKLGTGEITDRLAEVDAGRGTTMELEEVLERCQTVTDQSRCYLPTGESVMVESTIRAFEDEFVDHVGRACPDPREVAVPKITSIDEDAGEALFDPEYHRKRRDWSYAPEGADAES